MNVMRSQAQPGQIHVYMSSAEAEALRKSLPKGHMLRRRLKKVLRGNL